MTEKNILNNNDINNNNNNLISDLKNTNNEDLIKKQNFLKSEIIDQGFNPEDFTNYLREVKGEEGMNLESWKFEELQHENLNYKKFLKEKEKLENQIKNIENVPINNNHDFEINNNNNFLFEKENILYENDNYDINDDNDSVMSMENNIKIENESINFQTYQNNPDRNNNEKYLNCQIQRKNQLTDLKKLIISVSRPEIKKNSIFSFSYFQYTLTCPYLKTTVLRKLNEFEWFRKKLILFYPTIYIPPLPMVKFFKKWNEEFLLRKLIYIQKFINSLIRIKLIRSSQIFFDFISLPHEEFVKRIDFYNTIPKEKEITNYINYDGVLNITINPYLDFKAMKIENDINLKCYLYQKLNYALKDLMKEMDIISEKYKEVSNIFRDLNKIYFHSKAIENDKISNFYKDLTEIFLSWNTELKQQKKFFNFEIKYFFKYIQKELLEYNNIVKEYVNVKQMYNDYMNGKLNPEFSNFIQVQNYYGFILNKTVSEYEKLHFTHLKRLKKHFERINKKKDIFASDYKNYMKLLSFNL